MSDNKENIKERMIKNYASSRRALIGICEDYKVPFDSFLEFNRVNESISEVKLNKKIKDLKSVLRKMIEDKALQDWRVTIEKCYDDNNKESLYSMMKTMLNNDPATLYNSLKESTKLLKMLDSGNVEDAQSRIEYLCSTMNHEDFINLLGHIFSVKEVYKKPILEACILGYAENENKKILSTSCFESLIHPTMPNVSSGSSESKQFGE